MDEHSQKLFGLPVWAAVVALGVAGVLGYLIFFRRPSGEQQEGTTFSSQGLAVMQNPDESATMALQNQELAQIGQQLGQGLTALNNQDTVLSTQIQGIGTQIGTVDTGLTGQLGQISGQISGEQQALSGGFTQLGGQLGQMSGQLGQIQGTQATQGQADAAYYSSLLTNLTNYANSLSAQVQAGNTQAAQQLQTTQQQIQSIGSFLGWQFYQLPNRYTPFIPTALNPTGWH